MNLRLFFFFFFFFLPPLLLWSDRRFGPFDKVLVKANQSKRKSNTAENVGSLIKTSPTDFYM